MKRYIKCEYFNVCDKEIDKKNKNKKRICSCCEGKIDKLEKTYEFIKIDLIPYLDNINKNIFNDYKNFESGEYFNKNHLFYFISEDIYNLKKDTIILFNKDNIKDSKILDKQEFDYFYNRFNKENKFNEYKKEFINEYKKEFFNEYVNKENKLNNQIQELNKEFELLNKQQKDIENKDNSNLFLKLRNVFSTNNELQKIINESISVKTKIISLENNLINNSNIYNKELNEFNSLEKNILNESFDFSSLLNISYHYKYQENNIESEIISRLIPYIDKIKKELPYIDKIRKKLDKEILNNSLNYNDCFENYINDIELNQSNYSLERGR